MSVRSNITLTPTITASAYSSGYCVGGIQTISNASRGTSGSTNLMSVLVTDKGGNAPDLTILFFSASPSGGTYTDRSALSLSTADKSAIAGQINLQTVNYLTPVSGFKTQELSEIFMHLPPTSSGNLYALIVANSAFTPASTTDLSFNFGMELQ